MVPYFAGKRLVLGVVVMAIAVIALACSSAEQQQPTAPESAAAAAQPQAGQQQAPQAPAQPAQAALAPTAVAAIPAVPAVVEALPTKAPRIFQPSAVEIKRGGTFTMVPHADVKVVDPIWTTAYITRNYAYFIYDVLLAMDEAGQVQPQMVDTWKISSDALTYEFTLRDGLKFHDGQAVTTADVIPSIKRWGNRDAIGKLLLGVTDSIEAVDEKTFTLTLSEPFGMVLQGLGKPSSNIPVIMPARIVQEAEVGFEEAAAVTENIGSGPFVFEEWVPGDRLSWTRNPDYLARSEPASGLAGGKNVFIDRLLWLQIPDVTTRVAALLTQTVDYVEDNINDDLPRYQDAGGIEILLIPGGSQPWLRMNHIWPPFDDVRVRRAVMMAYNQEDPLTASYGDEFFWRTCPTIYQCGSVMGDAVGDAGADILMTVDLEGAQALWQEYVADTGWDEPVVFLGNAGAAVGARDLVAQQILRGIGITVDLQVMDWATIVARRSSKKLPTEGGWNLFHTGWSIFDLESPPVHAGIGDTWFGWYDNPVMEALRADWVRATAFDDQVDIARQIQELHYEDAIYINLGQGFGFRASRDYVKGIINHAVPIFWNIWLDK